MRSPADQLRRRRFGFLLVALCRKEVGANAPEWFHKPLDDRWFDHQEDCIARNALDKGIRQSFHHFMLDFVGVGGISR